MTFQFVISVSEMAAKKMIIKGKHRIETQNGCEKRWLLKENI